MIKMRIYEPANGSLPTDASHDMDKYTALVDNLSNIGASIDRYNLDDNKADFDDNKIVTNFLNENGEEVLPIVMVNREVVLTRRFPTESEFYEFLFPDEDMDELDDFDDMGGGCGCGGNCTC